MRPKRYFICPVRVYVLCIIVHISILLYLSFGYDGFHIVIRRPYLSICKYASSIMDNRIIFDDASYFVHHYPEFVCPQNFRNLADWIYGWPTNVFHEHMENAVDSLGLFVPILPNGSIIYVKPDSISKFFRRVYPNLQNNFVLITGQSDMSVPSQYLHYLEEPDSKIIHWFGQNGDIYASINERFTHIPIGINCFEMAESIRSIHQEYSGSVFPSGMNETTPESSSYIQPFDITKKILSSNFNQFQKLLLLNFDIRTDPSRSRSYIWKNFCKNESISFTTCLEKESGVNIAALKAIYQRNRQYPLWLSPRGNGLDCHRTWEALYLDVIPIVWHSTIDSLYTDLPVIIINSLSDLNEQFLRKTLNEIAVKKIQRPSVYRYEKLRNSFWRDMILKYSRHSITQSHRRENQCWRAKTINTKKN